MDAILLHHNESELSRALLASVQEGVSVVDFTNGKPEDYSGPDPSALPSVVIDVPAYSVDVPAIGPAGEFIGMERVTRPAHQEALRMPASWQVVAHYQDYVAARAAANPPV